jgi:MraZ protein
MGNGGNRMLIGEFRPTIDTKGRLNFPSKLRDDLGEEFIITKGLDNCLCVYPMHEWEKLERKICELPSSKSRNLQRFFFASATKAQIDSQGRLLIPQALREYASLKKDVTVIGASIRAEIWDSENYDNMIGTLTSEAIEEAMDELGF